MKTRVLHFRPTGGNPGGDPPAPAAPPAGDPPAAAASDTPPVGDAAPPAPPAEPTPEEKAAAEKAAQLTALHTPPADGKYTLALPKDSTLDASVVERTAAVARELGLSNAAAQKVLEQTHGEVTRFLTAEHQAFEAKAAEWKQNVLADPKYGKTETERKAAIDSGRQIIDVHFAAVNPDAAKELKAFLNESLYGNHPAVVSFMHYLGQQAGEGPFLTGAAAGTKPKTDAELFYGPKGVREKEPQPA